MGSYSVKRKNNDRYRKTANSNAWLGYRILVEFELPVTNFWSIENQNAPYWTIKSIQNKTRGRDTIWITAAVKSSFLSDGHKLKLKSWNQIFANFDAVDNWKRRNVRKKKDPCAVFGCNNDRLFPEKYTVKDYISNTKLNQSRPMVNTWIK